MNGSVIRVETHDMVTSTSKGKAVRLLQLSPWTSQITLLGYARPQYTHQIDAKLSLK